MIKTGDINFSQYPKVRPDLPDNISIIYKGHYKANRTGSTVASSVAQKLEAWMHKQVASTSNYYNEFATLEIGAGTLNQLSYENKSDIYDVIEPMKHLYEDSPYFDKIRHFYGDISEVPGDHAYHRITSVAVLEHVDNLPQVVARSCNLLAENGVFCAGIPNEGRAVWKLAWKTTTGIEFRLKYGADYGVLMRHEHLNTADEIEGVLRYFFREVYCKNFGINKSLSLYRYIECKSPYTDRLKKYLNSTT